MNLVPLRAIREPLDGLNSGREIFHLYVNPEHIISVQPNPYNEGECSVVIRGSTHPNAHYTILGTAHEVAWHILTHQSDTIGAP